MGHSLSSPNLEGLDRFAFETTRVDKPWGYELIWALTDDYCGKILFVRAGESWYVQSGRAQLEVGAVGDAMLEAEVLQAGASLRFRPGTVHRVRALEDTTILEVSTPQIEDVVRLEDSYGREGTSDP
jgi:mannose-6-phosphate isomerase